mgnify:CR=1 FL=1
MAEMRRLLEEESEAEKKKRDFDPNVGGGVDREKLKGSDFVFSDERTFPVVTPGDVSDAVSSWGRYKGSKSFEVFKKRLISLCKRKGQSFMDALPKEWKDEMEGNMKEAQSLGKQLMEIEDAWRAKYAMGSMVQPSMEGWLVETYEDYVIAKMADKYFKVTYQMVEDEITFAERGEWEEVEEQKDWVAKAEEAKRQQRTHEFREVEIAPKKNGKFEGREWEITLIGAKEAGDLVTIDGVEYVKSNNGRLYAVEALKESVPLWEGVKVYDNHLTDAEFQDRQGMRSPLKEWLGSIVNPKWDDKKKRLWGIFKVVEEVMGKKLKNAWDQGVLGTIGLSIDTSPIEHTVIFEGHQVPAVHGFKRLFSVDIVAEPAAGGGFNRLIAANISVREETSTMEKEELKKLVTQFVTEALANSKVGAKRREALIEAALNAAIATNVSEAEVVKTLVQHLAEAAMVEDEPVPAEASTASTPASSPASSPPAEASSPEPNAAMEAVRKLECQIARDKAITAAKLPEKIAALVVEAFPDGRVFEKAELEKFITRAKEAQAGQDPSGHVAGAGNGRTSVIFDEKDKMEAEFLRLVAGNSDYRSLEKAEKDYVAERVPESYKAWVKAGRPNYGVYSLSEWTRGLLGGDPFSDQRAYEAVTTSGMTSIVKNAMNVLLAADYAKRTQWWAPLVRSEEVDTIDQATLVRVFGLSTLSVVDEGQPYTELDWADEEETASFVKKGNYVGVTLESLLRDKLNVIRSLPTRLATSWFNTKSALAAAVFTVNTAAGPALADGGALFNATAVTTAAGHANLLTAALSFSAYGAARLAMRKQTDRVLGVGEKLLIEPKYLLVPVDLEQTALQIRNSEKDPSNADNPINPYQNKFEVVVVPPWTDTNNWALVADPVTFSAIWDINLRGNVAPALFTADSEVAGAMFTNDTLRYKVRMMTFRFSSSYDCLPVADFRPLHKSNVS